MPKCPECGYDMNHLSGLFDTTTEASLILESHYNSVKKCTEYEMVEYNEEQSSSELFEASCPHCGHVIANNWEQASKFLRADKVLDDGRNKTLEDAVKDAADKKD